VVVDNVIEQECIIGLKIGLILKRWEIRSFSEQAQGISHFNGLL